MDMNSVCAYTQTHTYLHMPVPRPQLVHIKECNTLLPGETSTLASPTLRVPVLATVTDVFYLNKSYGPG